jgi:hypothetical protein
MQTLHDEMVAEGHDFNVVIINVKNELDIIDKLTDICNLPVFQDVDAVNAWQLYAGVKDDIFVYTAEHLFHSHLSPFGEAVVVLTSELGKENMKNAILAAEQGL